MSVAKDTLQDGPTGFAAISPLQSYYRNFRLDVTSTDAQEVCVTENADCSNCTYHPIAGSIDVTLSDTYGLKRVYARLRNATGETACGAPELTFDLERNHLAIEARYQYAAGVAHWNDYGKKANLSLPCDPTLDTECVHVGSLRKVVTPETDCAGLSLSDDLNVFDWSCALEAGKAVFTGRLKAGKSLRDLLIPGAWKPNFVSLMKGDQTLSVSDPSGHFGWTSEIAQLPDSSTAAVVLNTVGKIYTTGSSSGTITSFGYNIDADKIAIVTLGSARLQAPPPGSWPANCNAATAEPSSVAGSCLIAAGSQNHLWIETELDGFSPAMGRSGILLYRVNHSKMLNLSSTSFGSAFVLKECSYNRIDNIALAASSYQMFGLFGPNAINNIVSRMKAYVGASTTSVMFNADTNTVASELFIAYAQKPAGPGAGDGLSFSSSVNPRVNRVLIANSRGGLALSSTGGVFHQIAGLNNGLPPGLPAGGLYQGLSLGSLANNNVLGQVAVLHNTYGVYSSAGAASSNRFTGNLLVGNNATSDCSFGTAVATGLVNGTCANQGTSDATLRSGISAANAIVGWIPSRDTSNASDDGTGGIAAGGTIIDFIHFDNFMRMWGSAVNQFPTLNSRLMGSTSTEGNKIWDWSLKAPAITDSNPLLNSASSGQANAATQAFASMNETDCPAFMGDTLNYGGITVLKNAVELLDEGGNNNGLCEPGETCLYTPNFGIYQGHGTMGQCSMANSPNAAFRSVVMKGYLSNGL